MLPKVLLVDSLEVAWETLGLYWMDNRGAFLDSLWRVGFYKAEVFEGFRVGSREFEVGWNVATQSRARKDNGKRDDELKKLLYLLEVVCVGIIVEHLCHSAEFLGLSFRVILLVR